MATIDIQSLRQPDYEKTTDSFKIFITSKDDHFIASVEQKVTFTPLRGSIAATTDAKVKVVQESTMVIFEISPQHAIYMDDEPEILVEFPPEVQI